jgi:hypothetical protein
MATQTLISPTYVGSSLNATCPLLAGGSEQSWIKEVASSTWVAGDLLTIDSNGKLAECTDSSGILTGSIDAIALTAASGVTDTNPLIRVIRPDDIFAMNVYHATAASAVTNQNQLTDRFGVFTSAAGLWHVDIENTTVEDATNSTARVRIVGFPATNPATGAANTIGDIYGVVYVKFLPFSIASDGTPIVHNMRLA